MDLSATALYAHAGFVGADRDRILADGQFRLLHFRVSRAAMCRMLRFTGSELREIYHTSRNHARMGSRGIS